MHYHQYMQANSKMSEPVIKRLLLGGCLASLQDGDRNKSHMEKTKFLNLEMAKSEWQSDVDL